MFFFIIYYIVLLKSTYNVTFQVQRFELVNIETGSKYGRQFPVVINYNMFCFFFLSMLIFT